MNNRRDRWRAIAREFQIHISPAFAKASAGENLVRRVSAEALAKADNIRFTFQTAKAPLPLFSQGAGSAGLSIPSFHEGNAPSPM